MEKKSDDNILLILPKDSPYSIVFMVKKSRLHLLPFLRKWKFTEKDCSKKYSKLALPLRHWNAYISRTADPFELKFSVSSKHYWVYLLWEYQPNRWHWLRKAGRGLYAMPPKILVTRCCTRVFIISLKDLSKINIYLFNNSVGIWFWKTYNIFNEFVTKLGRKKAEYY
jgi:hypothetical protein